MNISQSITYGKWSKGYSNRVNTFTEDEARCKYDAMEKLDVFFGKPDHPDIVIQCGNDRMSTAVLFLDDLDRVEMEYFFTPPHKDLEYFLPEPGKGKIVLQNVDVVEFLDRNVFPNEGPINYTSLTFWPDGRVHALVSQNGESFEGDTVIPEEDRARIMEETYPRFGEWDSLIRRDRDIPKLDKPMTVEGRLGHK